jgi:hypothetical protein
VTGDFDGDGNVDIAIAQDSGQVGVLQLLGDGRGAFPRSHFYALGSMPGLALAGDLDGDGRSDLLVFTAREPNVSVRIARSDGTLGDGHLYPIGRDYFSAVMLDANEDGHLDVAVTSAGLPGGPALLLGNGDGTLAPPVEVGTAGGNLMPADFDGDGHSDLALAGGSGVRVYFGDGRARFSVAQTFSLPDPLDVIAGDANGDGRADVIAYNTAANSVYTVVLRTDRSPLAFASSPSIYATGYVAATGDFDGDGRLDLVADDFLSPSIGLALGRGDGTFHFGPQFPGPGNYRTIAVTDLNNDGRPDVVAVTSDPQTQAPKLAIWLGAAPYECR